MSENFKISGRRAAPPPEDKKPVTIRLYSDDAEYLGMQFPNGVSQPIRKIIRKYADRLRKNEGKEPKGLPNE